MRIESALLKDLKELQLIPDDDDDVIELHELSKRLLVQNPTMSFRANAKAGLYNDLCNADYRALLRKYKALGSLFSKSDDPNDKQDPYLNIFLFSERLLNALLLCMNEYEKILNDEPISN